MHDLAIVADQSELAKFVQEIAHSQSSGADHLRQGCLTDRSIDWHWLSVFAEVGQQEKAYSRPPARRFGEKGQPWK
jgi:hypothetical protein